MWVRGSQFLTVNVPNFNAYLRVKVSLEDGELDQNQMRYISEV